jgi:hypothetical protein
VIGIVPSLNAGERRDVRRRRPQVPRIDEIRERLAKATPGIWFPNAYSGVWAACPPDHPANMACDDEPPCMQIASALCLCGREHGGDDLCDDESRGNHAFIAHAPDDVAYLLGEVERFAPKWRSLAEEPLPHRGEFVFVSDGERVVRAKLYMGPPPRFCDDEDLDVGVMTHWMPIEEPAPPKGES